MMSQVKKYSFLFAYCILALPFIGHVLGGIYYFLPLLIVFFLIPAVDYWLKDPVNPSDNAAQKLRSDLFYTLILMIYVPIHVATIVYFMGVVASRPLVLHELFGLVLSVGVITGGIGITIAHELLHRHAFWPQLMSKILLASVSYGHFFIEHVRGHHVRVATFDDPATARLNESFYRFYPRSVIGGFFSAWHLESKRLQSKKYSLMSWHNQFWWIIFAPITVALLSYYTLGLEASVFFILQGIIAFSTLEIVNYIEHYGLERKKLANGRYERVSPKHSWNANHWLTNIIIFHLQRHSDHHACPEKPYQILRHLDESPQLPTGYTGMILLALVPPLWFKVVNPKVLQYQS